MEFDTTNEFIDPEVYPDLQALPGTVQGTSKVQPTCAGPIAVSAILHWGIDFSACEVANDIGRQPTAILNERYNEKMRHYQPYAKLFAANDPVPLEIVPLIFTLFGSPSEQALKFFKQLKEASGREFKIKSLLNKIALICAHYNHQAVNFWRAGVTRKLSPQSYERQTGSKWQSAFQRHSHQ